MNLLRRSSFPVVAAVFAAGSLFLLHRSYAYPFPPARLSSLPRYTMMDMSTVLAGTRRIGSDIAWIQLLQYYGTPEKPGDKYTAPRGGYPLLYDYCRRVVDLDPFFQYAYLFGAGALSWNLERPDEAQALLRYGIETMERYRPDITRDPQQSYWQLHLYLSAIIYRKEGRHDDMIALLATAAAQPGAPNLVKTVLANIYQKQGNLPASLELWLAIGDSGDPMYRQKSKEKIAELSRLLGIQDK